MNEKALKALEYDKIIDQLTAKASSPMGKNLSLIHISSDKYSPYKCPHCPQTDFLWHQQIHFMSLPHHLFLTGWRITVLHFSCGTRLASER